MTGYFALSALAAIAPAVLVGAFVAQAADPPAPGPAGDHDHCGGDRQGRLVR